MSDFTIYKGSDAGALDLHAPRLWYFEPKGWLGGTVYSEGYRTKKAAKAAADAWAAQQAAEEAAASENLPSEDDGFNGGSSE